MRKRRCVEQSAGAQAARALLSNTCTQRSIGDIKHLPDNRDYLPDTRTVFNDVIEAERLQAFGIAGSRINRDRASSKRLLFLQDCEDPRRLEVLRPHIEDHDVGPGSPERKTESEFRPGRLHVNGMTHHASEHISEVSFLSSEADHQPPDEGEKRLQRHFVFLQKGDHTPDREAPVLGPGNSVSFEVPAIEPLRNGSRRNITDIGDL